MPAPANLLQKGGSGVLWPKPKTNKQIFDYFSFFVSLFSSPIVFRFIVSLSIPFHLRLAIGCLSSVPIISKVNEENPKTNRTSKKTNSRVKLEIGNRAKPN